MASEPPLYLLLLWHQHQPLYKDSLKNCYEMPWVRLHATKDYFDMVALLEEFPSIKANFNLVPSLLAQLDDYAQNKAQDRFLDITLIPAKQLSEEDRKFLLENFFMAHWEHMIDPYPRYRELLDKRGRQYTSEGFTRVHNYFKEQDWRDLQTWFNLAWFDPWWKEKDAVIRGLFEKGKSFTEEDKKTLVAKQVEICGLIVAKHRAMQEKGQIEVTTTPFYHPILPLLCDTDAARTALPQATLPATPFRHSEDAQEQLRRAVEDYTRRFGTAPQGMWPSEGSVSEAALQQIMAAGIRWVATDEGILAKSLPNFRREDIFRPYRYEHEGKTLHLYFRDHELSDAIGFVYATWDPQAAAKDFMKRLHQRRESLRGAAQPCVIPVILDGENCWEYYAQDGLPFLRALYGELAKDPLIITTKGTEFLSIAKDAPLLKKIWPGSWINSNFAIWIGHQEDNRAWELLLKTRQFLLDTIQKDPARKATTEAAQAWEEIYIAEGSDWCWWYGEDHSSANDTTFDYLFRKHLINVYTLMRGKVPEELHAPIKKKNNLVSISDPVDFITPVLDGRITSYYEWRAAGLYQTEAAGTGTMQKAENLVRNIYFGFDLKNLYFRLDLNKQATKELMQKLTLTLEIEGEKEINFLFADTGDVLLAKNEAEREKCGAYGKTIEFGLKLNDLNLENKTEIRLRLAVLQDNQLLERWPNDTSLKISNPSDTSFAYNWQV